MPHQLVIAFDAHVLEWSLDEFPPDEYTRHHIKEGSFYQTNDYSFDMIVKVPEESSRQDSGILVNFVGLQEKGIWPAKKAVKAEGGAAMALFERLDAWLEEKMGGKVDALLLGCVSGVATI